MSGTRRGATEPLVRPARRPLTEADGPPSCPRGCGFVGFPDDYATPWTKCDGEDQSNHIRPPVGAR